MTKDFFPKIDAPEKFLKFYAIPIYKGENGKIINNLFVFKLIVKKGDPSILYSTTTHGLDCPIRLQGQAANLTAEEIYKEIIERKKYRNGNFSQNQKNIVEFDDPMPIKSYENKDIDKNKDKKNNMNIEKENIKKNEEKKTNKKKNKNKQKESSYELWMTNISKDVNEKTILDLLGQFNCKAVNISKNQNGMRRGNIFFSNEDDANNCFNLLNNTVVEGKPIKLEKNWNNNV